MLGFGRVTHRDDDELEMNTLYFCFIIIDIDIMIFVNPA